MKQLHLSIAEPCHENWDNMNPVDQGKFCLSCKKNVVDFTMMTDREVYNFFAKQKSDNVCGRLLPEQMENAIAKPVIHTKKKLWYVRYLTAFFLFFSKQEAKAQTKPPVTQVIPEPYPVIMGKIAPMGILLVVTGKVVDSAGKPVPFASIKVKGAATSVSADANGDYTIKANAGDVLEIHAAGYAAKEASITANNNLLTVLTRNNTMPGEIVVTPAVQIGRIQRSICTTGQVITSAMLVNNITGTVVDDSGNPILFASIKIKGSNTGISADAKGMFNLKTKTGDILVVSATGYDVKETVVADKKEMTITLAKNNRNIIECFAMVGGISFNYSDDRPAPDQRRYIAQLLVQDKATAKHIPSANISIERAHSKEIKTSKTNLAGIYELTRIKEEETYYVTVSAEGYTDAVTRISGSDFYKKRIQKIVLLEKIAVKNPNEVILVGQISAVIKNTHAVQQPNPNPNLHRIAEPPRILPVFPYTENRTGYLEKLIQDKPIGNTKVIPLKSTIVLRISPNPALRNGMVSIAMENIVLGNYVLQLVSVNGQLLQEDRISVPASSFTFQWAIRAVITAGNYIIKIVDVRGKTTGTQKLGVS